MGAPRRPQALAKPLKTGWNQKSPLGNGENDGLSLFIGLTESENREKDTRGRTEQGLNGTGRREREKLGSGGDERFPDGEDTRDPFSAGSFPVLGLLFG